MSAALREMRSNARRDSAPTLCVGAGALLRARGGSHGLWLDPPIGRSLARHGAGAAVSEASINLVYNPRLGGGTTGYLKDIGTESSLDVLTSDGPLGQGQFLRAITNASSGGQGLFYGAGGQISVSPGVAYTFSVWVRGTGAVFPRVGFVSGGGGASGPSVTLSATWTRVQVTGIATASTNARLFIETTSAQVATIDAGAWQFEALPYATAYLDGSMGSGYAWSVDADASVSTRAAGRIGVPGALFGLARGGFALWWRPDDGTSFPRERALLHVPVGDDAITLRHDGATNVVRLSVPAIGGASTVEVPAPMFAAADDVLIVAAWEPSTIAVSVDGGAWVRGVRGPIPGGALGARAEVGSAGASNLEANGAVGPFWCWDEGMRPDVPQRLWAASRVLLPAEI